MKHSINRKIASSFLFALILAGALVAVLIHQSSQRYHLVANQILHDDLAQYILDHNKPLLTKNGIDKHAVKLLFEAIMHIGPSYELYVLDTNGRVVSYSAEPGAVKRQYVDVNPIKQMLISGTDELIAGDDPRSQNQQKVFSVAEIRDGDTLLGYLYIILGGQKYDSVISELNQNQIITISFIAVPLIALIAWITAMLLSRRVTAPLQQLAAAMQAFHDQQFRQHPDAIAIDSKNISEISQLSDSFVAMAGKIHQQIDDLTRTDLGRRQLIAHVSHDLRTPLANIKGYLETIHLRLDSITAEETNDFIEVALKHCAALEKLIAELFELARLDSGDTKLTKETFSINELAGDVVQKLKHDADRKSIDLSCHMEASSDVVFADIARIERVLTNLVDNSLRYTPPGGKVALNIKSLTQADNLGVDIEVEDNGPGIHEEDIPHLFEPYYRGSKKTNLAIEGTGLGLAITKKIVELHDSEIRVHSEPGTGSRFCFSLSAA